LRRGPETIGREGGDIDTAGRALPGLLGHMGALAGRVDVVVADGGSRDQTAAIARDPLAVQVVESAPGRAHQLNAGAA